MTNQIEKTLIQYSVTERNSIIDDEKATEYGIMQFTFENGEINKLSEISGISANIEDVKRLVGILSENDVEPWALYEVVEDYIIELAMVNGCR